MATTKFQLGEVVQLVSGGPHMTVVGYSNKGDVACCWFDREQKKRLSNFPQTALTTAPPEEMSDEQLNALLQKGKPKNVRAKDSAR